MFVEEEQGGNIAKGNPWTSSKMITLASALLRLLEWKDTYIHFFWNRKKILFKSSTQIRAVQSYLETDIHIHVTN